MWRRGWIALGAAAWCWLVLSGSGPFGGTEGPEVHAAVPGVGTVTHPAAGSGYENVFVSGLLVVADNDREGLDLTPRELTVREEDGIGAAYTVALKTVPKRPVTVRVGGAEGTDLVLGTTVLTFDADNWNVPQTVTVAARGDPDGLDEEVKLVHGGSGSYEFGGAVEVRVTVLDDDEPSTAVKIRTDTASVEEGGGARRVRVTAAYDGAAMHRDVGLRIDVRSGTADRLIDFRPVESPVLTIPAGEPGAAAMFDLVPVDDDVDENDETVSVGGVIFRPAGGLGLSVEAASVTIVDNDTRGVVIGPSTVTLEQGESSSYTIALTSRPTEPVTVDVVVPPYDGLLVRERSVVFGVAHWETPQEILLYARNDGTPLPDGPVVLTHGISGGDYGGLTAGSVAVSILERMSPVITVEDTRASEGAEALEFVISLDAVSARQVSVNYGTHGPGGGVNDAVHLSDYRGRGGEVSFAPGETRKRVRIALIDDELSEAEESFEFSLSNPREGRLPDGQLSLTVDGIILDDDPVPTVTLALSQSSIGENGGTASVTAALDHRSSVDTTITVSATPVAPATASDFTLGDNTILTIPAGGLLGTGVVTITAVDDSMDGPDKTVTVEGVVKNVVGVRGTSVLTLSIGDDDTAALSVSPASLEVEEEGSAQYRVALTSEPVGIVIVSVTARTMSARSGAALARAGAEMGLSVDKPSLTFNPGNWSVPQTVTVTAPADADAEDDHVMLVHTVRGGGYASVEAELPVTVLDNDGCVLNVADADARERDGRMVFVVNLASSCQEAVTVNYSTADGTARARWDYWSETGTLTFAAGESRKEVRIRLRRDCVNEEAENFYLRLSEPRNATLGDAEAVGTITNHGAMPEAWVGRFGRTVADHLFGAVEERLAEARDAGVRLRLGGQEVSHSRAGQAAEDPVDALRRRVWGEEGSGGGADMTMPEFLDRSAFAVNFGNGGGEGGFASVWGRGAVSRFDGREEAVSLDGEVVTGVLGGDYVSGRWLAGLALFHSEGDGAYRTDTAAVEVSSSLTGFVPYLGYEVDRNLLVWVAAGYGGGGFVIPRHFGQRYKTDMEMVMAAAGVRGDLVPRTGPEGFGLAAKADVRFLRATSERAAGMAAAKADVARTRMGLEGSYGLILGGGATMTPSMEVGLRHDTGDAERGLGLDVGAGLEWFDPASGLSAALRGRGLAAHAARDFRDWGVSGSLRYDAEASSERGMWLSVGQTYGSAADGGEAGLPGRETLPASFAGNNDPARSRLNAETGYGFPLADGRFTGAPYVGLGLSGGAREHRLGYRVSLARGEAVTFRMKIEVMTRRNSGDRAKNDRAVMLGGAVSW